MEVADQWRREWAGTAEYGKVTEGGVTRQIARAMEVLHASGPGARVRVMRAAYHSSAAPGAPAASFMLHSSRRVLSSGFNFLESPSIPNKPLEISSTPLESSPEPNTEQENYKVTEPDDFEISEPSKWRASTKGRSIRMPSEESSSTDTGSIIDIDSRNGKNLRRKYSYDSESSDIQFSSRNNSRNSPLLDMPTTLNTLKYKSLLTSSNEWNSRRKSYSFEDTSPLSETITHSNDTLAMDSSTDSGICKSSEIVNDHMDDSLHTKYLSKDERKTYNNNEETFRDWLSKNRPSTQYRGTKFKTYREHEVVMEDPVENNITLQSLGKVSITLPITIEKDDENYHKKNQVGEEGDRKVKRVEFCKTELHFAAESGKVNIIATDEKPPPSTDFRKRRSAFVPMQDIIEKPITLFGENNDFPTTNGTSLNISSEFCESDENTAATKSILKNKIPKPKPYLLGENMAFGISHDLSYKDPSNDSILSAVSLVNQQLKSEKLYKIDTAKSDIKSLFTRETNERIIKPEVLRTVQTGPIKNDSLKHEKHVHINKATEDSIDELKNKFNGLQVSPAQRKPKTRQLRDSELTYFGVDDDRKDIYKERKVLIPKLGHSDNVIENIFHSVKLIKQVSNSVCSSEPESDETPEYQNIPLNINYAPVPTPRLHSKYEDKPNEINEIKVFKPIIEKETQVTKDVESCTRRTKCRRRGDVPTSRSISAPPKSFRRNSTDNSQQRGNQMTSKSIKENSTIAVEKMDTSEERNLSEIEIPIYVNLNVTTDNSNTFRDRELQKLKTNSLNSQQRKSHKINSISNKISRTAEDVPTSEFCYSDGMKERPSDSGTDSNSRKNHSGNKDTLSLSTQKVASASRAKKIEKPHYASEIRAKTNEEQNVSTHARKSREGKSANENKSTIEKKDHRSRSLQRSTPKATTEETSKDSRHKNVKRAENKYKDNFDENRGASNSHKRNSSRDKSKETIKPSQKQELCYTARIPSAQSKSNEKDSVKKTDGNKTNKRREYVINYDDKNGTVSSICKITPSLGTPKRKKTTKEILKDNDKVLNNKTINKIAPRNSARRSSRASKRTEFCR